jgi:hypothetical protein
MLKEGTAPAEIEQAARELENWMSLKMVLEEQMASHIN